MLVLSQHIETTHAVELVAPGGFGYLLDDRALQVEESEDAHRRVLAVLAHLSAAQQPG